MTTEKARLKAQVDTGAVGRVVAYIELTIKATGALLHDGQTVVLTWIGDGDDATAVVFDEQFDALALLTQMHDNVFGLGMPGAVGQRLAGDL